jgi:uncharacterized protein (UPF0332 family)
LIPTARKLAIASPLKPRQAELKRAVSTAYYALFQAFARSGADMLVRVAAGRPEGAWVHVYRALDHGFAKHACREARNSGFPAELVECAIEFIELQDARHEADYDPRARLTRAETLYWVRRAEAAIARLQEAPRDERRAFAVHLLMRRRP